MRTLVKSLFVGLLGLVLSAPAAFAQSRSEFTQPELEQMLAPVALYPDALLSQVLMAATYPVEVVQAARWTRANPGLRGEDAVWAVDGMDWDPSVKSLVAFPHVLQRMDEKLDWTEDLGEAFIGQEQDVMDTVQLLRRRADAAGNLDAIDELRVVRQGSHILIEPVSWQVIYVPYYDPYVVYGPWWRPAHPPVRWAPWPGYRVATGYTTGFWWGSGISIRVGFFFGHFDWPHRQVIVIHRHPTRFIVNRQPTIVYREPHAKPVRWQHEQHHRRGAAYKHVAVRHPQPPRPVKWGDDHRAPAPRAEMRPSAPEPRAIERREAARPAAPAREPAPVARSAPERRETTRPAPPARERTPEARPESSRDNPGPRSDARSARDQPTVAERRETTRPAAPARERVQDARPTPSRDNPEPRSDFRPAGNQRNANDRQARAPAPAREQPAVAEQRAARGDDNPRRNDAPQEDRPRRRAMREDG